MNRKSFVLMICMSLLLVSVSFAAISPTAYAGWWEDYKKGVKSFTDLPQEVNELKSGYDEAMSQLNLAQQNIQNYRDENVRLAEQNELLAQTVKQLQQSEAERAASARFWKTLLFSAIGLVLLWFVFTRLVRFGLRRR